VGIRVFVGCAAAVIVGATSPLTPGPSAPVTRAAERIVVNDNRASAGILANGVLTIRLEARNGEWHPDREIDPSLMVRAFAEEGKPASIPGPLIRVPEGTEIHAFVRNSLRDTLTLLGLSPRGALMPLPSDTIQIKPGAIREVRFTAGKAGTYFYRGTTNAADDPVNGTVDAELAGAFVVDPRGTGADR